VWEYLLYKNRRGNNYFTKVGVGISIVLISVGIPTVPDQLRENLLYQNICGNIYFTKVGVEISTVPKYVWEYLFYQVDVGMSSVPEQWREYLL
jgi:hypothetical protein